MTSLQSGISRFVIVKTIFYLLIFTVGIGVWIWQNNKKWEDAWQTQTRSGSSVTLCTDTEGKTCFDLEIARTPAQREYGLMNRTGMNLGSGMIFIFDRDDSYRFWMKNTPIPLDILRVSSTGQIVDIQTALPCTSDPCQTYTPIGSAKYVIELNAGISKIASISTWSIFHFLDK